MYSKEMTKKRTSRVQASLLLWLLLLPASSAGVLPSLLASDTPSGSLLGAGGVFANHLADVCVSVSRSVFVSLSLSLFLSLSLLTCLSLSSALLLSPAQPVRRLLPRPRDVRGVAISIHRVMLPRQQSSPSVWLKSV